MKKAIKKISWTRLRRIPSIVDLVEDNSRSRYLFPLLAMTLYALVMFAIVNIVTEVTVSQDLFFLSAVLLGR